MNKIFKYPLKTKRQQVITLPIGAKILSIQNQKDIATMWALVDTEAPVEDITIETYGTGEQLPDYISMVDYMGSRVSDQFVWHYFKVNSTPRACKIVGPGNLNENWPNSNIKAEMFAIKDKYELLPITDANLKALRDEYDTFFKKHNLEELEFRVRSLDNTIYITPSRPLDAYAIKGIISLD